MDEDDQIQGNISKLKAHVKVDGRSPLHRAFSLFHFNSQGQLLLQKRSDLKVTFPSLWTNTVCSHQLYQMDEMDGTFGTKKAAMRRSKYECGLHLKPAQLTHLTRILYAADCSELLAESELDHCIASISDIPFKVNPDEISDIKVNLKTVPFQPLQDYWSYK